MNNVKPLFAVVKVKNKHSNELRYQKYQDLEVKFQALAWLVWSCFSFSKLKHTPCALQVILCSESDQLTEDLTVDDHVIMLNNGSMD